MSRLLTLTIFLTCATLTSGQKMVVGADGARRYEGAEYTYVYDRSIKQIEQVFNDYIAGSESTDSEHNKNLMTRSLESLGHVTDSIALDILINVWMYYDPTDYPSQRLVSAVLEQSRPESMAAVRTRMNNRKEWEAQDSAPFSDLSTLLKQLNK